MEDAARARQRHTTARNANLNDRHNMQLTVSNDLAERLSQLNVVAPKNTTQTIFKNILLMRHISVLAQNFLSKSVADMFVDFDQRIH